MKTSLVYSYILLRSLNDKTLRASHVLNLLHCGANDVLEVFWDGLVEEAGVNDRLEGVEKQ